jgi:hypothetical protein
MIKSRLWCKNCNEFVEQTSMSQHTGHYVQTVAVGIPATFDKDKVWCTVCHRFLMNFEEHPMFHIVEIMPKIQWCNICNRVIPDYEDPRNHKRPHEPFDPKKGKNMTEETHYLVVKHNPGVVPFEYVVIEATMDKDRSKKIAEDLAKKEPGKKITVYQALVRFSTDERPVERIEYSERTELGETRKLL